jgi:hypothetical protein
VGSRNSLELCERSDNVEEFRGGEETVAIPGRNK